MFDIIPAILMIWKHKFGDFCPKTALNYTMGIFFISLFNKKETLYTFNGTCPKKFKSNS